MYKSILRLQKLVPISVQFYRLHKKLKYFLWVTKQQTKRDRRDRPCHSRADENREADQFPDHRHVVRMIHKRVWTMGYQRSVRRHEHAERPAGTERSNRPELQRLRRDEYHDADNGRHAG